MHLLPMTDAHFAWLLGEGPAPADAPLIAEGGLASAEVLALLRRVAHEVGDLVGHGAAWMMVADGEGVGLISIKARDPAGRWDIGYGVAPSREGRGHASAAVAALKAIARAHGAPGLTAETLPDTALDRRASPRVLAKNGFARIGQFDHPEDGVVDQWVAAWD